MAFSGFDSNAAPVRVPPEFFTDLLPRLERIEELKVILYALWLQERLEAPVPYFRRAEIAADSGFMAGLEPAGPGVLDEALELAVAHAALLRVEVPGEEAVYLVNSPRGRAAAAGLAQGRWTPEPALRAMPALQAGRPNIFELYEKNIGPLTPLLADSLRAAEVEYPADWIEDAFRIALENNVRKWRYIEAILRSWQEKGRDDRKDQPDPEKDRRKYVEGEFARFIEK